MLWSECFLSSNGLGCPVGAGMVVDWEQDTGLLMTSGDVRVIRIWDTEREMKVQVRPPLLLFLLLSPPPPPPSTS